MLPTYGYISFTIMEHCGGLGFFCLLKDFLELFCQRSICVIFNFVFAASQVTFRFVFFLFFFFNLRNNSRLLVEYILIFNNKVFLTSHFQFLSFYFWCNILAGKERDGIVTKSLEYQRTEENVNVENSSLES